MHTLYCERHGKEHEARISGHWKIYRDEGESVLIVSGRLTTGPWSCDSCNAPLRQGETATLLASFPRWIIESMYDYDFGYERGYFAMKGKERMSVYGAAWPCGDVTALLRRRDFD